MNNLHRALAPISDEAWTDLEEEARRTFRRHVAGRRVVDVPEPGGAGLAGVGTGRLDELPAPADGLRARRRQVRPLVELRVPFTVDREEADAVARGAQDADWQPVKDAARRIAFAEDRAVFEGYPEGGIGGLRAESSLAALALPADARAYPDVVSQAVTELRLAGVDGPYTLVLSADAYTAVSETSDHGYPILRHLDSLVDGEIVWAPAVDGAFLLSTRGGDFALRLGQDLSIGYLGHDTDTVTLYFEETFTFFVHTTEAVVALTPAPPGL